MASIVVGELLAGKYRIEQISGEGGMGAVVLATRVGFDDRVAVKLLHPEVAKKSELVASVPARGRIAEAHSIGVVHRDLKPANLFLVRRRDGSPCIKVLDFGISKTTSSQSTSAALTLRRAPRTRSVRT